MFLPNCIKLKSEEWLSVLAHRVVWLTLTEAPAWGGGEGSWWKWEQRRRQLFYVFSGNRAKNESIAGQTTSDFTGSNITPWLCQRGMIYDVRTKKKMEWSQECVPGLAGGCGAHKTPEHLGLECSLHLLSGLSQNDMLLTSFLGATSDFPENAAARKSTAQDATLAISALITMN